MAVSLRRGSRIRRRGPRIDLDDAPARLVQRRRDAASALAADDPAVVSRVRTAPPAYLICHDAADVVRHCRLIDPCPAADEIRVSVTPARARWRVDVAARDQPGVLAAVTGVLAVHGLDVDQAVAATWDDGAALDAFVVSASRTPDLDALVRGMSDALGQPLTSEALRDAEVHFDDDASPWFTRCDVRVSDGPGVFHALAVAMTCANADVHGARATTTDGRVHDRFDLTNLSGHKLDRATQSEIRALVVSGVSTARVTSPRIGGWSYEARGPSAKERTV